MEIGDKKSGLGIVQIYCGDGKGKTTAACGLAVRAAGNGLSVGFFQFFKKPSSGEISILKTLKNVEICHPFPFHPSFNHFDSGQLSNLKKQFLKTWTETCKLICKKQFDLIILDEILIALRDGFLSEEKLAQFIKQKPQHSELVMTGKYMPGELLKNAGLVTEMKSVKHPFPRIKARKGIEY